MQILRLAVAFILITHPIYAFLHPINIRGFGILLGAHGIPFAATVAWGVMLLQIVCSLAMAVRRFLVAACVGNIAVLVAGIFLVHAPHWRTVGLDAGQHQQGAEFSVLLIACLIAIMFANWPNKSKVLPLFGKFFIASNVALELVRVASASILIVHPIGGLRDPAGLNDLGVYFSSLGFPFGIQLVWGSMFLQIASSLALVARRLVVPACVGHMLVLCTGI